MRPRNEGVTRCGGDKVTMRYKHPFTLSACPLVPLSLLVLLCTAAGPQVTIRKVDESTVTGTLQGLVDGNIVLTSPDAKVPLEDLVELDPKGGGSTAVAAGAVARKLNGKVIGTNGSYEDRGDVKEHAFDGDLA